MSLVGNFTFQGYDRAAQHGGVWPAGGVPHRGDDQEAEVASRNAHSLSQGDSPDDLTLAEKPTHKEQDAEGTRGAERVGALARQLTRQSNYSNAIDISPFAAPKHSALDPHSPNFSARAWAKSLLQLQTRDPETNTLRTSGIAFRDLNVHGFGSDTDYQKTVGNVFWEAVNVAQRVLGVRQRKIQILRGFDGVLNSGEMLVVLGPPGR
jgi:ATP-binding cassette subfamily G (WHITE) protein 2 (PDR)